VKATSRADLVPARGWPPERDERETPGRVSPGPEDGRPTMVSLRGSTLVHG